MKAKSTDWQTKLIGRAVDVRHCGPWGAFENTRRGTLAGFESNDSNISVFRVAYAPGDWQDVPVEDVELVAVA